MEPGRVEVHNGEMSTPIAVPQIDTEPVASLLRCLQLSGGPADSFVAESLPQARRIYGGQVVAQGLLAAAATVEDTQRLPHSLHAYFLRGGDPSSELFIHVDRLRDGRSFSGRHVLVTQATEEGAPDKEVLTLNASFQRQEPGIQHTMPAPEVPAPEELVSALEIFRNIDHPVAKFLGKTVAFDVRHVQPNLYVGPDPDRGYVQQLWMRPRTELPPMSQLLNRALLAYVIDQIMLEPSLRATGLSWTTPGMSLASLDHAMWFHQDVNVNGWLLFEGQTGAVGGARAHGATRVYSPSGRLVASAAQEGMIRLPDAEHGGSERWGFGS